jgi:hypothetical protein
MPLTQYVFVSGGEQSASQSVHAHPSVQELAQESETFVESITLSLSYSVSFMPVQ